PSVELPGRQRTLEYRQPGRRGERQRAVAPPRREPSRRPLQPAPPVETACQPDPLELERVAQRGEIDLVERRVEARRRRANGIAERRQRIRESGPPAVEPRRGVGHLEPLAHPAQRPLEIR